MTRISPYDALMHPWLMEDRSDSDEIMMGGSELTQKLVFSKKFLEKTVGSLDLRTEM